MKKIAAFSLLLPLLANAAPASDLKGVWSAFVDYGTPTHVELRLDLKANDAWVDGARVAGVRSADGTLEFTTDTGTLLLPPSASSAPTAYWIQPRQETVGTSYSNPVDLIADGESQWHGTARPRPEHYHLDLVVVESEDGLRAILRNPERNLGVYSGSMRVMRQDDGTVAFLAGDDDRIALQGTHAGERLDLQVDALGIRTTFVRHETPRAGYAPRPQPATALLPPPARDDGWAVAVPQTRGVDPAPLLALTQRIAAQDPTNLYAEAVHTMVLTQGGVLVFEESFFGQDPQVPHDTRSAGKSFSSTLVGLAVQQGYDLSPATRLDAVFAEVIPTDDTRKGAIELRHLMSMSSGLECDDGNGESAGNEDVMQSQTAQPDWIRYTLDLPMVHAPGEKAVYCSAGVNLASAVVGRTTNRWLPEFFDRHFAQPLAIRRYHVNLMPTGDMYVGGGVHMTARDLAKFGQLFLNDGEWDGTRVLPKGWATQAFAASASVNEADDYGWNWWRKAFTVDERRIDTHYAAGNGGQLVFVLPELDAVFVVLAGNYANYGTWRRYRDEFLPEYVIPALLAREDAPAR